MDDGNAKHAKLIRDNGGSKICDSPKITVAESRPQTPTKTSRRQDYTKAEKDSFEQWITSIPQPSKEQKAEYANVHNLTKSQLQNLVNNYRNRGRTAEIDFSRNAKSSASHPDPVKLDLDTLKALGRKSSYDSIEEYLSSPEDAATSEPVKRAVETITQSSRSLVPDVADDKLEHMEMGSPSPGFEPELGSYRENLDSILRLSWTNSLISSDERPSGPGSVYSAPSTVSAVSTAYSFSTSMSRVHVKKNRRKRSRAKIVAKYTCSFCHQVFANEGAKEIHQSTTHWQVEAQMYIEEDQRQNQTAKAIAKYSCHFCEQVFTTGEAMEMHETSIHCQPQTYPCTFCKQTFDSIDGWKTHETTLHCQPQQTWFCMLDGQIDVEKCLFCGELLPSRLHYMNVHNLSPCSRRLHPPAFNTRYDIMQHLISRHGLLEGDAELLNDGLDYWSVTINASRDFGLWACGYCGVVGADWNKRSAHIIGHWNAGGPRFTKKNPWDSVKSSLDGIGKAKYFVNLLSGKEIDRLGRPYWCQFRGFQLYEAAMKRR